MRRAMAAGGLLIAASLAGDGRAAGAQEGLLACQRQVARAGLRFAMRRDRDLARCLAKAMRCPAALDASVRAADDACLAAVGGRCQARLAAAWRLEQALAGAVRRCLAGGPILDDLGFADIGPFCPRVPLRADRPADAAVCQRSALGCSAAGAVADSAPRTSELLARLGVSLAGDRACLVPYLCGNQVLDDEEECDDGADNSDRNPDACRTTCLEASCGDGVVDTDEDCDDGNRRDGDGCDRDCLVEEGVCGNGRLEDDEDCDDGGANSDTRADACRTDCRDPRCGDRVVDPDNGEQCEPPNTLLCSTDCAWRLPIPPLGGLAGPPRRVPMAPLARCQASLLAEGARVFTAARHDVAACVLALGACVVPHDVPPDRCLARAERHCARAAAARDATVARRVRRIAARCALDPASGVPALVADTALAFGAMASLCAFPGTGAPAVADVARCALERVSCAAERAVAESVPRAREYLDELVDVDPEAAFPLPRRPVRRGGGVATTRGTWEREDRECAQGDSNTRPSDP
jgi:cysteine-rich repeat protein